MIGGLETVRCDERLQMMRQVFVGIVIVVVVVSWFTAAIRAGIEKWRGGEKEEACGIIFSFVLLPIGGAIWYWLH